MVRSINRIVISRVIQQELTLGRLLTLAGFLSSERADPRWELSIRASYLSIYPGELTILGNWPLFNSYPSMGGEGSWFWIGVVPYRP